jgi:hypothetical protein
VRENARVTLRPPGRSPTAAQRARRP